ncbi:hypothetical protein SCYAM73S_07692 [Streptomyces cyaneofuscatus]
MFGGRSCDGVTYGGEHVGLVMRSLDDDRSTRPAPLGRTAGVGRTRSACAADRRRTPAPLEPRPARPARRPGPGRTPGQRPPARRRRQRLRRRTPLDRAARDRVRGGRQHPHAPAAAVRRRTQPGDGPQRQLGHLPGLRTARWSGSPATPRRPGRRDCSRTRRSPASAPRASLRFGARRPPGGAVRHHRPARNVPRKPPPHRRGAPGRHDPRRPGTCGGGTGRVAHTGAARHGRSTDARRPLPCPSRRSTPRTAN